MRAVHTWVLVFALLTSFSRAPFDHIHLDPHDHCHSHHQETAAHSGEGEPAWEAPDHDLDAVYKDWLAHEAAGGSKELAEPVAAVELGFDLPSVGPVRALVTHNHDPPAAIHLPARAPPTFLPLTQRPA